MAKRAWFVTTLLFAMGVPGALRAELVELFDASLGTLPAAQDWVSIVLPPATQSHTGSYVNLNTTADRSSQAGYFTESPANGELQHPLMPSLDRNRGFAVHFELQILSEAHDSRDDNGDGKDDRAGFSVITISEDLFGLELAFFENRIWAYAAAGEGANSKFTQAEGVDFDTTAAVTQYDLEFSDDSYRLFADGIEVLTGNVRNYNPSGVNPLLDPYDNPSSLFFGDDTTSAESEVLIGSIEVSTVPEPGTWALLAMATAGIAASRLRKRRGRSLE